MKKYITVFLVFCSFFSFSQTTFYIEDDITYPDFSVRISDDVTYPDITIKIGSDVSYEDFTVGVTSDKSQAQFIISKSMYSDYTVRADGDITYPDLSIKAGEDVSYPDLTIKILKSGTVDYIIYSEKDFISLRDLVVALLPAIQYQTKFKFKVINELFRKKSNYLIK